MTIPYCEHSACKKKFLARRLQYGNFGFTVYLSLKRNLDLVIFTKVTSGMLLLFINSYKGFISKLEVR